MICYWENGINGPGIIQGFTVLSGNQTWKISQIDVLMGKSTINGICFQPRFDYRRVLVALWCGLNRLSHLKIDRGYL